MNLFTILVLLQVKHFVFDWVLQTDYQIDHKGQYLHLGGLHHSFNHGVWTAVVFSFAADPTVALALGALDGFTHYHVDWAKQNLSRGLSPADKPFWWLMGVDQSFHQLTYLFLTYFNFSV